MFSTFFKPTKITRFNKAFRCFFAQRRQCCVVSSKLALLRFGFGEVFSHSLVVCHVSYQPFHRFSTGLKGTHHSNLAHLFIYYVQDMVDPPIYIARLDPPRVSSIGPQVCFWWLRSSNFRPLEYSGTVNPFDHSDLGHFQPRN